MRTTISLPDAILIEAKTYAAQSGRSLNAFVEDAVRAALARRPEQRTSGGITLPTFRGEGPLPGVDLHDTASLLDVMDDGKA
jgi:hypothetical protein